MFAELELYNVLKQDALNSNMLAAADELLVRNFRSGIM
jgi:hypothetical protein